MPANFAGIQVSSRGQPLRRWTTARSMADHGWDALTPLWSTCLAAPPGRSLHEACYRAGRRGGHPARKTLIDATGATPLCHSLPDAHERRQQHAIDVDHRRPEQHHHQCGKMQKISGNSSFSAIFAARSSARIRRRVRSMSDSTRSIR